MLAPRRLDFRTIQKTNFFATEVGKNVTYIALAAIGAYLLYSIYKSAKKKSGGEKLESDKYADIATSLYNALYPGGTGFFTLKGADEEKAIEIAKTIDSYEAVAQSYATLFDRVLTDDLLDRLGNDYQAFRDALKTADVIAAELTNEDSTLSLLADNINTNTYKYFTSNSGSNEKIPMIAAEFSWDIVNGLYNLPNDKLKILVEIYKRKGYGSLYQRLDDSLTTIMNFWFNDEQDSKNEKISEVVDRLNSLDLF